MCLLSLWCVGIERAFSPNISLSQTQSNNKAKENTGLKDLNFHAAFFAVI